MHRIHASTVVALLLGVILTLVVALQMLPAGGTADASAPARAGLESAAFAEAATLPLPLFFAWAVLAILLTAAVLLSATKRSGRG